jgi:hypothetical protein
VALKIVTALRMLDFCYEANTSTLARLRAGLHLHRTPTRDYVEGVYDSILPVFQGRLHRGASADYDWSKLLSRAMAITSAPFAQLRSEKPSIVQNSDTRKKQFDGLLRSMLGLDTNEYIAPLKPTEEALMVRLPFVSL